MIDEPDAEEMLEKAHVTESHTGLKYWLGYIRALEQVLQKDTTNGTKRIPLSEPMGGDATCCTHSEQCRALAATCDDNRIQFRCPFTVEVGTDVTYAGEFHDSCFNEERSNK